MKLPTEFITRMQKQLGGEWERFVESCSLSPWQGLRANRLKISPEALKELLPFPLEPVRWCADGFSFPAGERPAKLTEYRAGLFYIQEPSAMLPAEVLDVQPGERVLDLCAAPGGKSVQLAGKLKGTGILVSNDVSATRSRALVQNLELAGVTNATVTNEQPVRLAERFAGFFDKILVDAPCSGEGMFRRDRDAAKSWAENKPDACAATQREILKHAATMLKPFGCIVYSTCTFSEAENEEMISEFLKANPDFSPVKIECGRLGITEVPLSFEGASAARIWPHKADGEGHFTALLKKEGGENIIVPSSAAAAPEVFKEFCAEYINIEGTEFLLSGSFTVNGVSLYRIPQNLPDLRGLRLARSGWYMGDISKGRFAPSQALAMGLKLTDARVAVNLPPDEGARYLKGETISPEGIDPPEGKPWVIVGYMGYPLGWAKWVNGRLKNYLPVGWVAN